MSRALIIVDLQHDFIDGSLAVPGGQRVADDIRKYLDEEPDYDYIIATMDWHINPGDHWSDNPDFIDSWPVHCKAGSRGAQTVSALNGMIDNIFKKGRYEAAYSGFQGTSDDVDYGNSLKQFLDDRGVAKVDVCGLAYDFCVLQTALDSQRYGFDTSVLVDLTAAVSVRGKLRATNDLLDKHIKLV